MGIPVLILGESGTGKSTSLRNLKPGECLLIQTIRKPLPFRSADWKPFNRQTGQGSIIVTDNWKEIATLIKAAPRSKRNKIIIDDFQYLMVNEFMRRSMDKGFDKFTEIANHAWEVIRMALDSECETRFYFLSHTEQDQMGRIKIKTIGKMLDEKITIEGMFSIVLRTHVMDGRYQFTTQNNGNDTVKSPMGLFSGSEIDNDLSAVDNAIQDYYGILPINAPQEEPAL